VKGIKIKKTCPKAGSERNQDKKNLPEGRFFYEAIAS